MKKSLQNEPAFVPAVPVSDPLIRLYEVMNEHFGALHWWPGDSTLEILIGAVLTQNTAWRNVEKAIENLKRKKLIDIGRLLETTPQILQSFLRPAGCFRVKEERLRCLLQFIADNYEGDLDRMFKEETWSLRNKLLGIRGIGEETADCILLYGGLKNIFVVDAYTRRILGRHGLIDAKMSYGTIQHYFMDRLVHDQAMFGQYHALLVEVGKTFCKKEPQCESCPLRRFLVAVNPVDGVKERNGERNVT
jgi:endonuclease-3 related protein